VAERETKIADFDDRLEPVQRRRVKSASVNSSREVEKGSGTNPGQNQKKEEGRELRADASLSSF